MEYYTGVNNIPHSVCKAHALANLETVTLWHFTVLPVMNSQMDLEQGKINVALFQLQKLNLYSFWIAFVSFKKKVHSVLGFDLPSVNIDHIFNICCILHGLQNMLDVKTFFLEKLKSPKLIKIWKIINITSMIHSTFCTMEIFRNENFQKWKF